MKRKTMVPVAIVLLVLLDQLVKWYVVKNIPLGIVKSFIPHVVSLTYLQNTGAAFSLLENQQWFFTLITLVVMVGAFTISISTLRVALDGDRFDLGYLRWVGEFYRSPASGLCGRYVPPGLYEFCHFNVADSYLTVGVFLLLILMLKEETHGN